MSTSPQDARSKSRASWLGWPIGVLLGVIWLYPALFERREISAALDERLVRVEHLQASALQIDVLKQQRIEFRPLAEAAAAILPDHFDDDALRADVRQSANAHGLHLVRLELGDERKLELYAEKHAEMELSGPPPAVLAWLDQVSRTTPLRVVDSMHLTAIGSGGSELSATLRWRYFRSAVVDANGHRNGVHGQ